MLGKTKGSERASEREKETSRKLLVFSLSYLFIVSFVHRPTIYIAPHGYGHEELYFVTAFLPFTILINGVEIYIAEKR